MVTPWLDRLAAIAMIVSSIVMAAVAVSMHASKTKGAPGSYYAVGDRLEAIPELDLRAAEKTLVVFVSASCKYCTASMPFYGRLISQSGRYPIVFVSYDSEEVLRDYVDRHGLKPDHVVSLRANITRLRATPTLLLVSSTSKVEQLWFGRLQSESDEAGVLRAITR